MSRVFDCHVHLPTKEFLVDCGGEMVEHGLTYFGTKDPIRSIEAMATEFKTAGVAKALLLGWDAETATKRKGIPNDHIAELQGRYPDLFLGVASVDPHKSGAVDELDRAVRKLGLRGVKLHPQIQAFYPNDPKFRPLWKKIEQHRLPVVIHTGTSGLGAGSPGGDGIHLDYSRPIHIDAVAADFPQIPFLCAHAGWPWHDELLAMSLHKSNVYIDISGWLPKYLPESVLRYANSRLQDKFVFGSDYPFFDLARCLQSMKEVQWKDGVLDKLLWSNAARIFRS